MKFFTILSRVVATLIAVSIIVIGGVFVVCGGNDILPLLGGILGVVFGIFLLVLTGKSIFELGKKAAKESEDTK